MQAPPRAAPALPEAAAPLPQRGRLALMVGALLLASWIVLPRLVAVHPMTTLATLRWPLVMLALVAQVAMQVGRGRLVRVIADSRTAHVGWGHATMIVLGASSIGLLGGGFPGYVAALYRWMRLTQVSVAAALAAGSMPSILSNLTVAVLTLAAASVVSGTRGLTGMERAAVGLALLTASAPMAVAYWLAHDRESLARWSGAARRAWWRLRRRPVTAEHEDAGERRLEAAWQILHRPVWRQLAVTAIGIACCDLFSVWALLAAAHQSVAIVSVCLAWGIPQLLGNVSMLPGGVGVVELTMLPMLERAGVASGPALAVVLSYRLLAFWLPLLTGAPIILWLERRT